MIGMEGGVSVNMIGGGAGGECELSYESVVV